MVGLAFGDLRLAIAVSSAIVAAGTVATTIGLLLRGSSSARDTIRRSERPVATILQDVTSLIVYFGLATLIVR